MYSVLSGSSLFRRQSCRPLIPIDVRLKASIPTNYILVTSDSQHKEPRTTGRVEVICDALPHGNFAIVEGIFTTMAIPSTHDWDGSINPPIECNIC